MASDTAESAFPSTPSAHRPPEEEPAHSRQPAERHAVSADGWARFEYRTRLRRLEKRAEAARAAIARGRFDEAAAALRELRSLDQGHPELISLSMELDAARHLSARKIGRRGPWLLAAAVLAAVLVGATLLDMRPGRGASAPQGSAPAEDVRLPAPPSPTPAAAQIGPPRSDPAPSEPSEAPQTVTRPDPREAPPIEPSAVSVTRTPASGSVPRGVDASGQPPTGAPAPASPPATRSTPPPRPFVWPPVQSQPAPAPPPAEEAEPAAPSAPLAPLPEAEPPPAPGAQPVATDPPPDEAPRVPARTPAVALASAETALAPQRDEDLVRRVLQQYRLAYEELDARSAQAVWPRVNEAALQRAFDGLESQRLTFADCQVDVRGTVGSAVCRGSARYVTKIGSREPKVEPRVWNFSLMKSGDDWQIESARTQR